MHTRTRTNLSLRHPCFYVRMYYRRLAAAVSTVLSVLFFRQDVPGTSKGIFFVYPAWQARVRYGIIRLKAARTAAAACETGRAVCGCGAVKGPVVPLNGEQGGLRL